MAAPTGYHNGINIHNNTAHANELQTRVWGEPAITWGDHLARINVFPREGCTGGPTTFDFVGHGGGECWNYKNANSIQAIAFLPESQKFVFGQRFGKPIGDLLIDGYIVQFVAKIILLPSSSLQERFGGISA
ncbi:MAG: hypothetical protein Q9194_001115 [Teloschistes cf. exilis]